MCEKSVCVCCVLVLKTMPCSHKTHCVDQYCLKTIIGCDCYPLLLLRFPNDFLFHSEPKVARWDPLHQYRATNSVLGVDVNMGGWSGVDVNMGLWGGVDEWE